MYTGKVVGSVVSTVKDPNLEGIKLLVVQKIENGKPGGLIIASDATRQAGYGDMVYIVGSKEAGLLFRKNMTPSDASICGFVDEFREYL